MIASFFFTFIFYNVTALSLIFKMFNIKQAYEQLIPLTQKDNGANKKPKNQSLSGYWACFPGIHWKCSWLIPFRSLYVRDSESRLERNLIPYLRLWGVAQLPIGWLILSLPLEACNYLTVAWERECGAVSDEHALALVSAFLSHVLYDSTGSQLSNFHLWQGLVIDGAGLETWQSLCLSAVLDCP